MNPIEKMCLIQKKRRTGIIFRNDVFMWSQISSDTFSEGRRTF